MKKLSKKEKARRRYQSEKAIFSNSDPNTMYGIKKLGFNKYFQKLAGGGNAKR